MTNFKKEFNLKPDYIVTLSSEKQLIHMFNQLLFEKIGTTVHFTCKRIELAEDFFSIQLNPFIPSDVLDKIFTTFNISDHSEFQLTLKLIEIIYGKVNIPFYTQRLDKNDHSFIIELREYFQ